MDSKVIYNLRSDIPSLIESVNDHKLIADSEKETVIRILEDMSGDILNHVDPNLSLDCTIYTDRIKDNIFISENSRAIIADLLFSDEILETTLSPVRYSFINILENAGSYDDGLIPVFFIFNGGDNILSSAIRRFTKGDFSHVSISTEGLSEIVSFGTSYKNNGLMLESFYEFIDVRKPKIIAVHSIRVSPKDYETIRDTIEFYKRNINSFRYSFKKLFMFPFSKSEFSKGGSPAEMICSEFCNHILHNTEYNKCILRENTEIFVSPQRMRDLLVRSEMTHKIFEGSPYHYESYVLERYIESTSSKGMNLKKKIDSKIIKKYDSEENQKKERLRERIQSPTFYMGLSL